MVDVRYFPSPHLVCVSLGVIKAPTPINTKKERKGRAKISDTNQCQHRQRLVESERAAC